MKYHYSLLERMPSFFSHNVYLRNKSRSFFTHCTIFCKKRLHMQFFLKMAECWGINIYVVWKTTIVSLSVCRAFFSYNPYLRDKWRSFLLTGRYFVKNDHKLFVLKMAEGWGINIYFVRKTTIVPLSVCRSLLVTMCICVTNQVLFLLTGRYFVKNACICNFFSKWRNAGV